MEVAKVVVVAVEVMGVVLVVVAALVEVVEVVVVVVGAVVEVKGVEEVGVVVEQVGVAVLAVGVGCGGGVMAAAAFFVDVFAGGADYGFAMVPSVLLVASDFYSYSLHLCPFHQVPMVVGDQTCAPS